MPDYQKMYITLFNAMTDSIRLLQDAQREAEELYNQLTSKIAMIFEAAAMRRKAAKPL